MLLGPFQGVQKIRSRKDEVESSFFARVDSPMVAHVFHCEWHWPDMERIGNLPIAEQQLSDCHNHGRRWVASIATPLKRQSDNGQCAPLGDGKLRMAVVQRNVIGTSMLMRRHYTDNAL